MSDSKNLEHYRLERAKQEYQDFVGLINQYLDLERWGFVQTYSRGNLVDAWPVIIYDSQWCRVKLHYDVRDHGNYREREASVWYGRLHAPSEGVFINSSGKEARCWHGIYYYVLNFLDGLSPQEIVDGKGQDPRIIHEFDRSALSWVMPDEYLIAYAIKELRLHNMIWAHYGQKLFELFDVRNPELWDKYVQFHHEIERLKYEDWKTKTKIEKPFRQFDDYVPDELC